MMKGNFPEEVARKSPKLPIVEIDRLIHVCEDVLKSNRLDRRQRLEMEYALSVLKTITEDSRPEDDVCTAVIGIALQGLVYSQKWLASRTTANTSADGI